MADPTQPQNAAQKNAQNYFRKEDRRPGAQGKQMQKKERAAGAANTARLRELRLAKEAVDKAAADALAAESPAPAPRKRKAAKVVTRFYY